MKIKEDLKSTLLWGKKRWFNSFSFANPQVHGLRNPIKCEEGGRKTERDDEWQEKKRQTQAVQWLRSGTEDQSPGGRGLTGIFSEEENALITQRRQFWENSNSGCHHFFMEQVEIHQDVLTPLKQLIVLLKYRLLKLISDLCW